MRMRLILFSMLAILLMVAFAVVIVKSSNTPPKAESQSVTTREDMPVSITLAGSDRDGNPLTYSVVARSSHGTLSGTVPHLTYNPDTNFSGTDRFSFKVSDGKADSAEAAVSITVTPVNHAPAAENDKAAMQEDAPPVTIDVLANDSDPDHNRLTVVSATQGVNGSVSINTDGTLTYAPNRNFCGTDTFSYTISDGKGGIGTATVSVFVEPVNDAPVITSKPPKTVRVWAPYTYKVKAKDPDVGDRLTYSLTKNPEGMTIDPTTGLIDWRPTSAQAGTYDVVVKVSDSYKVPASDTQSFTLTVTSLSSPLTTRLTVEDCFGLNGTEKLSARDKISTVQASDNSRLETEPRSSTCYKFSDGSIPDGASVKSVVVYVEHFEAPQFPDGKLEWTVGTGWPAKPTTWASIKAPVRPGEAGEALDCWDVTSAVETAAKANALELLVQNNATTRMRKTSVDYVYAVVKWY
jgi:VCBS repeat-containing protein